MNNFYESIEKTLAIVSNQLDESSTKAFLANLRKSIGKDMSESVELFPIIFEYLPEEYLGKSEYLSKPEQVFLTTLQIFALMQSGNNKVMIQKEYTSIGKSLSFLRGENSESIDARFNSMITSDTFEEFTYHLRHLLKIYKARTSEQGLNYIVLAKDLFKVINGEEASVRVQWSRDYYKVNQLKGADENEK